MEKLQCLNAFRLMGAMTVGQLSRFMAGTGIDPSGMADCLAELVENKSLKQSVSLQGLVYSLTAQGRTALENAGVPGEKLMEGKAEEFRRLFAGEKDYLAQYTEQANAVVPVFLSIRDGDKILLKISIIVETVEEAKNICAAWMSNSRKTYETVWGAIAGDAALPAYYTKFLERRGPDAAL